MKKKTIIITVLSILIAWFAVLTVDYVSVIQEMAPIFCIETQDCHYTGLGYAFDRYPHPITGKMEFVMYLFGKMAWNNVTN